MQSANFQCHPVLTSDTIDELRNLAAVYRRHRQWGKALEIYGEVLALQQRMLGASHPTVAATLCNMAQVFECDGNSVSAGQLYLKAGYIWENRGLAGIPAAVDRLHLRHDMKRPA